MVTLRLYHGLNDAEIVGLLGCPEHVYRATLKEGMQRMAKRLLPRLYNLVSEPFTV